MLLCHEHRIAMIKKRDEKGKQNKQKLKKTAYFFVYSRRATYDPHQTYMVIEEVRPIFCAP